jgi:ubiquinone/menaquinone biosynthesis C-methylase UbiE
MPERRADGPAPPARWQGRDYARHSAHHRTADDWFIQRYRPGQGDVVVDLGCGSGEFTARLASMVPDGRVTGVEPDRSMLAAAREHRARNLFFVQSFAQEVDRVIEPESVDLVVSRAMLHWIPQTQHPRLYEAVFRVLRQGGVAHLEAGGPGNIAAVIDLLEELAVEHGLPMPPAFPDPGRALDRVEAAGFEVAEQSVRTVARRRTFTRDELIGFLSSQVVLVLTRHVEPERARIIAAQAIGAVERLRRHDGTYDQTFVRLELLLRRPA